MKQKIKKKTDLDRHNVSVAVTAGIMSNCNLPRRKKSFMQTPIQKTANNKHKQTRSTGSMPRASGSHPSRTLASKLSIDQD